MKKIILLLLVLSTYYNSFSQLTYVPDDRFEALLIQYGLDDVLDDYVLTSNIASLNTTLWVNLRYIQDFTGLQDFVNIKGLIIHGNQITTLDVTGLSSLEYLYCDNTYIQHNTVLGDSQRITSIVGLSSCPNLENLYLQKNELTTLDVSNNPLLIDIDAHGNMLTSINLNNTTNLIDLNINNNKLNTINLTQSALLNHVYAGSNLLTSINLNNTTNLSYLDLRNNNLNTIDLTSSINLTELYLNNNSLGNLNLVNNPLLTTVDSSNNTIGTINLNGLVNLSSLTLTSNNINTINLSSAVNLTQLAIDNNQLTSLDLSQNANLILASCNSNNIVNINATSNSLQFLLCFGNALTQLDLTGAPQLLNLSASYNTLSTIDVSNNLLLTDLDLNSNSLSTIDVTNNVALTKLNLKNNSLSSINVDNNVNLTQLILDSNQLKRLNLDQNINLNYLYCEENQLAYINLNNCPALIFAFLEYNNLIEIKLQNGNNQNMYVKGKYNPDLTCVEVDDQTWSTTNWTGSFFDPQVNFSFNCGYAAIWYDNVWSYLPSITHDAIALENYETSNQGNLDANNLTIFPNATLTIGSNSYVKLQQDLTNNGNLNVMHQGSFVQTDNMASVLGSGNFSTKIQTTQLDRVSDFTYFSSPVENQDLNVFNSWARMNRLWRFDESIQDWYQIPASTIMQPAVGYAIQGDVDTGQYPFIGYAGFSGKFNTGNYTYPLTYNPGGTDDDNVFIGNPYPCAIDGALLLNNNTNATSLYFWTHKSGILPDGSAYSDDDYAIWNNSGGIASASGTPAPSGFIASGQGFFVEASGSGILTFDNSIRVTENNTDFRSSTTINRERLWLNLTNNNQNLFNQILLNFSENGTTNFDTKYDATRISSNDSEISFYSNGLNQEHFAIQAIPQIIEESTNISLGFTVNSTTHNFTISIDNSEFNTDKVVYLKDNYENITHNLTNSSYQFNTENGIYNNRFEIQFQQELLSTSEISINNNLIISDYSESKIKISAKNGNLIKQVIVYDLLGKNLLSKNISNQNYTLDLTVNTGTVLIIKAKLDNGKILFKKFIKIK